MGRKALIITIVICFLVLIPLCFSCKNNDEIYLALTEDQIDITYAKALSRCTITWPYQVDIARYKFEVYPTGDLDHQLYKETITPESTTLKISVILTSQIVSWQYLDIYITGYNDDYSASSNTFKMSIVCSIEEEDVYIAEEQKAGVIDGYEDAEYYFARLADNVNIVKPSTTRRYAIVVGDVSTIDSVTTPYGIGGYTLDSEYDAIVFNPDVIESYSLGARIPFVINYKDGTAKDFTISLVRVLAPNIAPIRIERGSGKDIVIDCLSSTTNWEFAQVIIDGEKIINVDENNKLYTTTKTSVKLASKLLNSLSVGDHSLRIYYIWNSVLIGFSETTLTIDQGGKSAYNVNISFDDSYPAVSVSWDADYTYYEAIVKITKSSGVSQFSSKSQSAFFNGNSFTIANYIESTTDRVNVILKYGDGTEFTSDNAYLDVNMSEVTYGDRATYFNDVVYYLGKKVNRYISSEEELNDFIAYQINHYSDSDSFRTTQWEKPDSYVIYSPYLVKTYQTVADIKAAIANAFSVFIEPLSYKIDACEVEGNKITFKIYLYSGSTRPYSTYHAYATTAQYIEYPNSELHYYTNGESTRSATYDSFKVNSITKTAQVTTSLELALALEAGLKPIPVAGSNAELIYNKAKEVLRSIIDDKMSDYEKVLAIYDWITYNIIYDRGLTKETSDLKNDTVRYGSLYKNSSFYAEGVFLYGVAVCNGIGSAFSIMSNIEGIPAIKTMGTVKDGSHTWVKVYVDDEWYVCDPTWSNARDERDSSQYYEYITYDFFMMSEPEAGAYSNRTEFTDKPSYKVYAGDTTFDYFAVSSFAYDGNVYSRFIGSTIEFEALINYYTSQLNTGKVIQFSVKGKEIDSYTNTTAKIFTKWLETIYYDHNPSAQSDYIIDIFARSTDGGKTTISNFANTVYIRIEKR